MRQILLIMFRKMLAEAITGFASQENLSVVREYNYNNAATTAACCHPDVAVLEMPERGKWTPKRCVELCGELPECKKLVLCPENNEEARNVVAEAKKSGRIDDFVYYDTSMLYLIDKLKSL